jgi:hypothetical protein
MPGFGGLAMKNSLLITVTYVTLFEQEKIGNPPALLIHKASTERFTDLRRL